MFIHHNSLYKHAEKLSKYTKFEVISACFSSISHINAIHNNTTIEGLMEMTKDSEIDGGWG